MPNKSVVKKINIPKTIPIPETPKPWLSRDITTEDLPMIYKMLKEPFPIEAIKEGQTHYGLKVRGVRSQYIVDRLNDVLGVNHWTYRYNSVDEPRGKVYSAKCDIVIEIGNFLGGTFVPVASRPHVGGCNHIDKYEAHKGAITNAMKKCASMFGVASDIYKGLTDPDLIENGQTYEEMPESQYVFEDIPIVQGEELLPMGEKGDAFSLLLTELNSVKDKTTFVKAKEMMDKVSGELTAEQMATIVGAIVELEKKYGK